MPKCLVLYSEMPTKYLSSEEPEIVLAMQGMWLSSMCFISNYVPISNSSSTPRENFLIRKSSIKDIDNIVGYLHTHEPHLPNPSPADLEGLPECHIGVVWCDGKLSLYRRNNEIEVVLAFDK